MDKAAAASCEGWSRVLDLRDRQTEGHTRRVTERTLCLARTMDVGGAELVQMRRGALLHGIGKMGIPDTTLLKPGPLADEEWCIMRRHPTYAHAMLSPIEFLRPALAIPYCHHPKCPPRARKSGKFRVRRGPRATRPASAVHSP